MNDEIRDAAYAVLGYAAALGAVLDSGEPVCMRVIQAQRLRREQGRAAERLALLVLRRGE